MLMLVIICMIKIYNVFDEEFTQASIESDTHAHKDKSLGSQETGEQVDSELTPIKDRNKENTTTEVEPSRPFNETCTPESIRPYPLSVMKEKRNGDTPRRGRKKGKSRILTSTPEKNKIMAETDRRLRKVQKFQSSVFHKNQQSKRRVYKKNQNLAVINSLKNPVMLKMKMYVVKNMI